MITYVKKQYTKEEVLQLLDPLIAKWFDAKFSSLTEPQAYTIPLIHQRKNVLVSSPTGSGKTLTAFLSIINELYIAHKTGKLEDKIYCVYVSPLKALANDINKNLKEPLAEIQELARKEGLEPPEIRVAVRSGDTTNYERQKMARKPPHIFITTPESLSLVLSTPKFSTNFTGVQYVIIDEIHEISNSKRGVFLSLTLERLQNYVKQPFVRIGLSATQAPIEMIAKFLVGYHGKQMRDVDIVQASRSKDLDLSVVCPVTDMTTLPYEVVNWKMYDLLSDLIGKHRTTLVFTNTRSGTESIVYKLKEKGLEKVAAHHGSLSRETRLEVEDLLRKGSLKCVVSSTSLELGIDIGHIDLVCQIGSPKSVAKGLQRIGRSGHGVMETSKGRMIVMDKDDLVETAVLTKKAHEGEIDRIDILQGSRDVLAQGIIGMALEEKWDLDDAYDLISRAYCYHNTTQEEFMDVVEYLAGKYKTHDGGYGRIWLDPESGTFGAKKGTRMMFYLNLGTIPEEANYRVLSSSGPLGNLSEKFVERLGKGDVFVLGGRTYEFQKTRGMSVFVKDAQGRRPTVPSWSGEMLPRSFDLSMGIGAFRRALEEKLGVASVFAKMALAKGKDGGGKKAKGKGKDKEKGRDKEEPKPGLKVQAPAAAAVEALRKEEDGTEVKAWLMKEYHLDEGSATTILNYFWEQATFGPIPTDKHLIIEGYADQTGAYNIIFHFCFGRRVNDALSRAYAHAIGEDVGGNVRVSLTDDDFMLTVPRPVDLTKIMGLVDPKNLEKHLRAALKGTELFRQRFRHCAMRGFMILRNYKGREIPVSRQVRHSSRILAALPDEEFPIVAETYDEILKDHMDLEHATEVLREMGEGRMDVEIRDFFDTPSPFAHNVVMIGASDIIMLEDRSSLLRELHQKVLERVMADMPAPSFSMADVKRYFETKVVDVRDKEDILDLLRILGPMNIFQDKGESIYRHSAHDHETLRRWAMELVAEGRVVSVWKNGTLWCAADQAPIYKALHGKDEGVGTKDRKLMKDLVAEDGGGPWRPEAVADGAVAGPGPGHGDVFGDDEVAEAAPLSGLDEGDEDGGLGITDDVADGAAAGRTGAAGKVDGPGAKGKVKGKGKAGRSKLGKEEKKGKAEKEAEVAARKKLERAYMIRMDRLGADGEPLWSEDGTKPADFDDALRHVIRNALEYRPPMTLEEMSYTLALPENLLGSLLKEMTNEVIPIHIDGAKRFIQIKDKVRMENTKVKAFDDRTVRGFLLDKHFDRTSDVSDFFVRFPEANMLMDVYNRVKDFSIDKWWSLRQSGQVLEGRFVRGRVGYMDSHLATLYSELVPRTELRPVDKAVLETLKEAKAGSRTLQEMAKLLGDRYSREVLRDSVDTLDRSLRIVRAFSERKEWPSRNRYMLYHPKAPSLPSGSNPAREVVIRAIEAYGPLTLNQLRHHTNLSFDELNRIISELETGPGGGLQPAGNIGDGPNGGSVGVGSNGDGMNGDRANGGGGGMLNAKPGDGSGNVLASATSGTSPSIIGKQSKAAATAAAIAEEAPVAGAVAHATALPVQRIAVVGSNAGQVEMFLTASDLEALERWGGGAGAGAGKDPIDGIRVLSQMDPYASRFWIEVTRRYGEGWYHVIMKDGEPVGKIEIWNLSGSVEVRDLVLDSESLLGELLDELDEVCGFFEIFGIDIIRVRAAFGKDVTELSAGTVKTFTSHGYIEVQGMLVKGNILQRTFPKSDVMLYLFHKQHLTEDHKFGDTMEALRATGGLHSEFEVDLRVKRFFPLKKYENEVTACLAIPEYHTYVPNQYLGLLKRAKNRHLDENMTKILELLKHYGTLTRKELSQKMSVPQAEFNDSLKALYSGLHILKNNRSMFYINSNNGMAVEEARSDVMWRIMENFGIISAEVLASYTKHEFKMGEIRERLRRWESEGKLVKGFLVDGDDALYWMQAADVETVGKHSYKGIMVLTSMDPLVQFLAEEIRERFGIGTCHVVFNGPDMIGAFKATRHKGVLSYHKVVGDELVVQSIKAFGRRWGLKVQRKEDAESEEKAEEEDWEIIQWYEKKKKME